MSEKMLSCTALTDRYVQAVAYTAAIHATQIRKGSSNPYICHLLGVSSLVLEAGGNEDQAIAGLLHDAAEDQGGEARLADIAARFGSQVERIIRVCSDSTDAEWKARTPYWPRKLAYLKALRLEPVDCVLVSIADKVHNCRAILTDLQHHADDIEVPLRKFKSSREEMLLYYVTCLDIAVEKEIPFALTLPLRSAINDMATLLERAVPEPVRE